MMTVEIERVRLHKFLAGEGFCSRREAERWIGDGEIKVNGVTAKIGQKIVPGKDNITVRGIPVKQKQAAPLTFMVNKPAGLVCSNKDPHHNQTVFDLLPARYRQHRLFCAGRLDMESEGLLILTSDGTLAQRITHPRHEIIKRYHVWLNKPAAQSAIAALCRGVRIDGEKLKAEKIIPVTKGAQAGKQYEVLLNHGRKREIRRMFEHFGYYIRRLQRYQIGGLILRGLGSGQCRLLTDKEINLLLS